MVILKNPAPICPLCGKPVEIERSNTDSDGAAVHEDCYTAKMAAQKRANHPTE